VEIKGQLDATDWFFIAKFIVHSTCFGQHYVHHQELKSYTDGCCLWYLALWFTGRWSGVELWVMYPVCVMTLEQHPSVGYVSGGMLLEQHHANQTHNPQLHTRPMTCKPKRQVP